jgi:hypothetical protein
VLDQIVHSHRFIFVLLLYGFDALPPCGVGMPLDAAACNAVRVQQEWWFSDGKSGSALLDISIYIDEDSIYFKTQTKRRLRCL